MKLFVVLNPSAHDFRAQKVWPQLEQRLRKAAEIDLFETQADTKETRRRLLLALETPRDRVLAIGGDGTVHLVVDAVMESAERHRANGPLALPELAVIPFGTANNVAKSYRLPIDDDRALTDIAIGPNLRPLDIASVSMRREDGHVDHCHFVDSVTIGMDADILATRSKYRELGGYLAYGAAMAERAVSQRSLDVRLTVDGEAHDLRLFNLVVNNVPVYAGELWLPRSEGGDGKLDVYTFDRNQYASKFLSFAVKQLDMLKLGVDQALDELTQNQAEFHGKNVEIRLASPREIQADGEAFGQTDEAKCTIVAQIALTAP